MSCSQTLKGIPSDCATSRGGITDVWIANFGDVVGKELTDEIITTITMAAEAKFKHYSFKKNTGSLTSTLTKDEANSVQFVTSDLALIFGRMETAKRIEMEALSAGELAVIVKDANGKYWFLGYDAYVTASAGTGQTGTASTDGNNYQITLQDQSSSYPYEVAASALADILD